jgi:HD-GYP domain-containing protein (c-di-GMP phosphodiesterase class II)
MVRFSDIIKQGITKKGKPNKYGKSEKQSESFRLSALEELKLSVDKKSPPAEAAISKTDKDIKEFFSNVQRYIKEVRKNVVDNRAFKIDPALILINKIINTPDQINEVYQSTTHFNPEEDYTISRPINILAYALKIGQGMGYSRGQLLELGLYALLYDVGMFKIPESITKKKGKLADSEVAIIRKHPEIGRAILSPFKEDYPWLPRVAYEHHERENGQGYPSGLKGEEICEYAKIVGIVDSYEAMIHNRPHRKAITQHVSIRELIFSKSLLFSSKVIKAFIKEISIYPIGSYVRLNNKAVGQVIATNEENPMKPALKLLSDGRGNIMREDEIIKLDENPLLHIAGSVSEEEIPH